MRYPATKRLAFLLVLLAGFFVTGYGQTFADTTVSKQQTNNRKFALGIEIGSSIDLTANNLSTFDSDIVAGYRNSFIQLAGIGIGIHKALDSSNNFIPLYAVFRSSFRNSPSKVFLNATVGYSFNSIESSASKGGFNMSLGLGIHLWETESMRSHLILSYGLMHLNDRQVAEISVSNTNISMARICFGLTF